MSAEREFAAAEQGRMAEARDRDFRLRQLVGDREHTWTSQLLPHLQTIPKRPVYWPSQHPTKKSMFGTRQVGDWEPGTVMAHGWPLGAVFREAQPSTEDTRYNTDAVYRIFPWWLLDDDQLLMTSDDPSEKNVTVRLSDKNGKPTIRRRRELDEQWGPTSRDLTEFYSGAFSRLL